MSYDEAFQMLQNWLDKCNELRSLDPNFSYKVKYSLNASIRKQQLPLKLTTLESKNKELYEMLVKKTQT